MRYIELILAFRGIDVPTMKMMGRDACPLWLQPIVDRRLQEPSRLLFAHQRGTVWRAIIRAEPAQYRLTLLSAHLHCSQDISVDEDVLSRGELHVEFDRARCRRKLIPVFLMRLWWNLGHYLEERREDPKRDGQAVSRYRRRFRRGPIGSWVSSHDQLMVCGTFIEFRRDRTGTACRWGLADPTIEQDFRWECVGDYAIDVRPVNTDSQFDLSWRVIHFDFRVSRSPYGKREVLMYSKDRPDDDPAECGFWWSSLGVVLLE